MTTMCRIMQSVDIPENQLVASLDGKTGSGGCDICAARWEIIHTGRGMGILRITHEPDCTYIPDPDDARSEYLTNRDPGDEQA